MDYLIRKVKREDSDALAHVIYTSWNETYKGIVSDEYLSSLNEKEISSNIYNNYNLNNHQFVLEVEGKIVGFINVGETKEDYDNCGEIHALYIINGYKGYGFGKKLVNKGIQELKDMNFDKMVIGCLVGNPSNEFYKHLGGKLVKTRIFEKLGLEENVYYFEKI